MKESYSRRNFIKTTLGAGVVIAGSRYGINTSDINRYDPKDFRHQSLGIPGFLSQGSQLVWAADSLILNPLTRLSKCAVMPLTMGFITGIRPTRM